MPPHQRILRNASISAQPLHKGIVFLLVDTTSDCEMNQEPLHAAPSHDLFISGQTFQRNAATPKIFCENDRRKWEISKGMPTARQLGHEPGLRSVRYPGS